MEQCLSLSELLEESGIRRGTTIRGLALRTKVTPRYMRVLMCGGRVPTQKVIIGPSKAMSGRTEP